MTLTKALPVQVPPFGVILRAQEVTVNHPNTAVR